MKIHIIGASGSGKTYLADRLSAMLGIPAYELDTLLWDNSQGAYNVKRSPEDRDAMLEQILQQEDWILEGVQYSWCAQAFAAADVIYFLEIPRFLCRLRIIRRFLKGKLCGNGRNNETLKSVIALLRWTKKFYNVNLIKIKDILSHYPEKVIFVTDKAHMRNIINQYHGRASQ